MKRTIRQLGFAGLALCCSAVGSIAGESVNYHFNGWTVTVTPRRSETTTKAAAQFAAERYTSGKVQSAVATSDESGVLIRPVSLVPAEAANQLGSAAGDAVAVPTDPAPVADDALPRLKAVVELAPAVALPPSPVLIESPKPLCTNCALPIITPRPAEYPANPQIVVPQTALYRDIYFSIPFNRVEYNAVPSYRHDATMELLFNQMRPTVIQRGATNVNQFGLNAGYYGGYPSGYPYTYPYQPYYPFSYGLRIHRIP